MRTLIILLTLLLAGLSVYSSLMGVRAFNDDDYTTFATIRGTDVTYQMEGLYKFNTKSLVAEGIGWDAVRLFFAIPVLLVSAFFYLRGSFRGTLIFLGILANFFYQYFLWAIGWTYNGLFLNYVTCAGLSIFIFVSVFHRIPMAGVPLYFTAKFPRKSLGIFCIALSILLIIFWGQIIYPSLGTDQMPGPFKGLYSLTAQAMDLSMVVPFSLMVGILLLRKDPYGYLLGSISLLFLIAMCLAIVLGASLAGYRTGQPDWPGILVFCILLLFGLVFLGRAILGVQTNIKSQPYEA